MHARILLLICLLTGIVLSETKGSPYQESTGTTGPSSADTLDAYSDKPIRLGLAAMASVTSNKQVPFWMRSNQFGSVPLDGPSLSLIGNIGHNYSLNRKNKLTDWGFYVEPRLNIGRNSELILIEGYAKGRLGIFQLKAGRSREIMGLVDSTLSSGAFSVSGNSLGIPKVEISIPEFWDLPFLKGILAVKGNFAHGWLGNTEVRNGARFSTVNSYFHQKSAYARLGTENWPFRIYGGFNHQVFWGNEKEMNPTLFKLSVLETYKRVIFGQSYGGDDIGLPRSKVGNHLGSIDQAIEFDAGALRIMAYHQFFFEVGGLYHLNNVKDGIFGLSIANKNFDKSTTGFRLKKILFEYVATKSQGGEADAKITPSGDEDYYNNYIYVKGWSYRGENIGNPLITSRTYSRSDLPMANEFYINNRITAFHTATELAVSSWSVILRLNYSLNYGTYGTSPLGHSLNDIRIPSKPPYFQEEKQFSSIIEASRRMKYNTMLNVGFALDEGSLLYNSTGAWIKLSKSW
ncbi:capsule assembly Wzi family protein [Dyadobacter chenwenxiniae]|uniref:Capsule assembly Wzi family protein n=1 Tax=Dyadobacter chenwenxiniae TaxID=2906456 RepID=A0A9X1PJR1_9BACT|nr:capsule assembly Wzi family protein [Dyadobacter chenwenxiniae]MCF0062707.1 capsule assembly Wzi family protein [Dyadobacter chenwenxiniae]UON83548.1 capsule assembly Wzi family protein [Dyadobacter chenwenxiniae]